MTGAAPATATDYAGVSYLDGVSGPRPAKMQDLSGTWQFQPLVRTACPVNTCGTFSRTWANSRTSSTSAR